MFLGENLLPLLTLAVGGGLAVGTLAALVRPRTEARDGELEKPPLARSVRRFGERDARARCSASLHSSKSATAPCGRWKPPDEGIGSRHGLDRFRNSSVRLFRGRDNWRDVPAGRVVRPA